MAAFAQPLSGVLAKRAPYQFLILLNLTERHATEGRRLDAINSDFCDHGFCSIVRHDWDYTCNKNGHYQAVTRYQETIEQIVYAEELGFDTVWLVELHFNPSFSIMPTPLLLRGIPHALRVRITAPLAVRAARVAEEECLSLAEAEACVRR